MGVHHGSSPWEFTAGVYCGPWEFTVGVYHGSSPHRGVYREFTVGVHREFTAGVHHGSLPVHWEFTAGVHRGSLPREVTTGVYHGRFNDLIGNLL